MRMLSLFVALISFMPVLSSAGPVNINTADASTLAKELKGIGPARAQAIVDHRTQRGPFKSADELTLVKGIPQKVVDDNRENIRVDGAARPAAPAKAGKPAAARPATAKPATPPVGQR
jgi:competence protein ComEA